MPLPKPNAGEKQQDFVSRCMGDATMNKDYPEQDQRAAVCYSQWEKDHAPTAHKALHAANAHWVTLSREVFPSVQSVEAWLLRKGFMPPFYASIESRPGEWTVSLNHDRLFADGRERHEAVEDGVMLTTGILQPATTKKEFVIRKAFDINKPLSEATLGEYSEALRGPKEEKYVHPRKAAIMEFLETPYKSLMRVNKNFAPYRANLVRYGLTFLATPEVVKAVRNFDYDEECPPEYITFSTGAEKVDGLVEALLFLDLPEEGKLVLTIHPTFAGGVHIDLLGTDKEKLVGFLAKLEAAMKEHNYLRGKKLTLDGSFITPGKVTWEDIVLPAGFADKLQKHVVDYITKMPEMVARGLPTKRGLLVYGPPGNGKTMIGKALANELACTFIWVPFNSYDGYEHIYEMARELAPTVVLLEDLATQGGMGRHMGGSHVLGELLNLLDGVEENTGVVTLATENFVNHLDVALRNRPGRFDVIMQLPNPAQEQRLRLLRRYLPEFAEARLLSLAQATGGFSCAHMRELANRMVIENPAPNEDGAIVTDLRNTFGVQETSA